MLEVKITITAPDLEAAINNLAKAMIVHADSSLNGIAIGATHSNTTCAAANETTPAQQNPTQATGVPVNVTPAQTAVPTAPTVPVVPSVPAAAPTANTAPAVPTAAPQYTLEMLANAGTALIDAGKMNELAALLAKYGVEALTSLDPAHYGAFATELRAMGAQI